MPDTLNLNENVYLNSLKETIKVKSSANLIVEKKTKEFSSESLLEGFATDIGKMTDCHGGCTKLVEMWKNRLATVLTGPGLLISEFYSKRGKLMWLCKYKCSSEHAESKMKKFQNEPKKVVTWKKAFDRENAQYKKRHAALLADIKKLKRKGDAKNVKFLEDHMKLIDKYETKM